VELVRQGYEAWNRGDLEWQLKHVSPDFEFRAAGAPLFPDTEAVYRGRDGWRQFWEAFREPWETLRIEVERIEPIGDDRVLALIRFHGRGRDGIEMTLKFANLLTLRDGIVSRLSLGWGRPALPRSRTHAKGGARSNVPRRVSSSSGAETCPRSSFTHASWKTA
jgi:ketosteroid isomerase-like protein